MVCSVIIPTYNESQNLPIILYLLFEIVQNHSIDLEIIIVEDNSPDGTLQIAKQIQKVLPLKIDIVERSGKLGLGSAYREGLKRAKGDFVILMDADLSHHPKYIPLMLQKQAETQADIVASSRYIPQGGVEGWTFMRKLTSRVANFIATWTLGTSFSDLTGSYRLYRRELLEELMGMISTNGYAFQMEMLIRASKMGKIITEIPIVFVDRIFGKSKLGVEEVGKYLISMGIIFMQY